MYTTPFAAEMKQIRMIVLTNWPADFHPARTKPMVNGEEATVESALSKSGELEGQMSP